MNVSNDLAKKMVKLVPEVQSGGAPVCPICGSKLDITCFAHEDRHGFIYMECQRCDIHVHFTANIPQGIDAKVY